MTSHTKALEAAYHAFAIMNIGGEPVPKYAVDYAITAYLDTLLADPEMEEKMMVALDILTQPGETTLRELAQAALAVIRGRVG